MHVSDYDYHLPPQLIAQFPPAQRSAGRLLKVAADGRFDDLQMTDIVGELNDTDLLVLNDTRVIPARLFGHKDSGGRIEILLERILGPGQLLTQIRASKAPRVGQGLQIDGDPDARLTVTGRDGSFFQVEISVAGDLHSWFEQIGHMPLPPYIERAEQVADAERYQTVFARQYGAVAAPTAGLHYDLDLLDKIKARGVSVETITLHVGAGTYQPVRVSTVEQHKMHSEVIEVSERVCRAVCETREKGGRVVAVGTTVVRSLETAAAKAQGCLISPYSGETDIFIYPGYEFRVVDMLQTNFHLPQSTLLMLVAAFAGRERIFQAYQHAIQQQYRFFSYGDAMLLQRPLPAVS